MGRASYDAAQEIRNGKITREEGKILVKKYDSEFPKKYFEDFLESIVDSFRSPHLWSKDQSNNWILKKSL